jgi:hypothetical protein
MAWQAREQQAQARSRWCAARLSCCWLNAENARRPDAQRPVGPKAADSGDVRVFFQRVFLWTRGLIHRAGSRKPPFCFTHTLHPARGGYRPVRVSVKRPYRRQDARRLVCSVPVRAYPVCGSGHGKITPYGVTTNHDRSGEAGGADLPISLS